MHVIAALLVAVAVAAPSPAQVIAEFKVANRPSMDRGVRGASVLSGEQRVLWCERLTALGVERLAMAHETVERLGPCALRLHASAEHQLVPGVKVHFDVERLFAKPYAAASYDRDTKVLFLPLEALVTDWTAVQATRHEWRHARISARAAKSPVAKALMAVARGPDFMPDDFFFDEAVTNVCDLVDASVAGRAPPAWQGPMTRQILTTARQLLERTPKAKGVTVDVPTKEAPKLLAPLLDLLSTTLTELEAGSAPGERAIELCTNGP